MPDIWWTSVSIEIFLCCLTATTAHLLMSLGQTLFHRYLGHRASEEGSLEIIWIFTTGITQEIMSSLPRYGQTLPRSGSTPSAAGPNRDAGRVLDGSGHDLEVSLVQEAFSHLTDAASRIDARANQQLRARVYGPCDASRKHVQSWPNGLARCTGKLPGD
jgi:hypothetical protein